MFTLCINEVTLLIHHIIIFDESLTDTEVILLHFLLRTLDTVGDHAVLNHLAFLEAHSVHHTCDTLATEHTHQVIFQTHVEYGATRISLTTGTTA